MAIIAIVVIVILLLALLFSGLIPGFSLNSKPGGGGNAGPSYAVTFTETGLPSGTSWSLTLGGTQQSSATATSVFQEPNGTYSWTVASTGYRASPASGSITVSGAAQSQGVTFSILPAGSTYSVTFTETGLPTSTSWSVTFNGTQTSSSLNSIVFTSTNGTSLAFTVGAVAGYTASPASGTITVAGAAQSQGITFTSNSGGGGQDSYSTALPIGQSAAGSGWLPIFAYGIDFTSSYTNSTTRGNATCPVTGGSATWPTIPAYTGNYHDGLLTGWIFVFYQSSTFTEKAVYVAGTSSTVLGELTGANCISGADKEAGLGSGLIDSTTVASTLATNATIQAFVSSNTTASAYFFLVSGNASDNAFWLVDYSSCSPGTVGPGYVVGSIVNASSATIKFVFAYSVTCSTFPFVPHGGTGPDLTGPLALLLPGAARPN